MQYTDAIEILERMYTSEINFNLESCWDIGIYFVLLDEDDKEICSELFNKITNGAIWLAEQAAKHYPQSTFAKWWEEEINNLFEKVFIVVNKKVNNV